MSAYYFIINGILNQSQDSFRIAQNTVELFERLKVTLITSPLSLEQVEQALTTPTVLHRFPKAMSKYAFSAIEKICTQYNNKPEKIFFDKEGNIASYNLIFKRLIEFDGIGIHKAQIIYYKIGLFLCDENIIRNCLQLELRCPGIDNAIDKEFKYTYISGEYKMDKIFFDITKSCNGKCIYCYTDSGEASKNELTTSEIKKLIDELHLIGVPSLSIAGGEPFVRKDILEILNYTKNKVHCSVTTSNI